jgi:hypothetical protein
MENFLHGCCRYLNYSISTAHEFPRPALKILMKSLNCVSDYEKLTACRLKLLRPVHNGLFSAF